MKSVLTIDETWTIDTFRGLIDGANEILQHNELPYANDPFATIQTQQQQMISEKVSWFNNTYSEEAQVRAVQQNLDDYDKAYAIAMLSEDDWAGYSVLSAIMGCLTVPETMVTERNSVDSNIRAAINQETRIDAVRKLLTPDQTLDPVPASQPTGVVPTDWFWKPTGEVMFGIEGQDPMEIPCWPDSVKDSTSATWSQEMTTYQHYEPKNTYKGSGPRTVSCTFKLHRAMWDGNQDSGNAEALVAYMESACYPDYDTQAAEPPRSLLVIGNSIRIKGIMTSFDTTYQGPIGPDTKYDEILISISITEESDSVLSTEAVRSGLAGWR